MNSSHRAPYRRHEHATLNIAKKGKLTLCLRCIVERSSREVKIEIARKRRVEVNDRHQCLRCRLLKNFQLISCIAGFIALARDNKSVSTAMTIIFLDLFVTWQHYVAVAWLWCRSMRPKAIGIDAIGGAIHLCSRIATFCWHPSYCCSHFLCCRFSFSYALTTFSLEVSDCCCLFVFLILFLRLAFYSHY